MLWTIIKVWATILLLPVVPVVIFYLLFNQQNYFELDKFFKGVVASGPIAAYVFLVWIGWYIYQKIVKLPMITSPAAKDLPGKWKFESISAHRTTRRGTCYIRYKKGSLVLNGTLEKNGEQVGQWNSVMTSILENRLMIFYNLREIKEDKEYRFEGISSLIFGEVPINEMKGCWSVVGITGATGTIKYTKVKA